MMIEVIPQAIWLILPAYMANSSAVLIGGGKSIDFGKKWKGKRIFGDGKTWRGFIGGTCIGCAAGCSLSFLHFDGLSDFGGFPLLLVTTFSLSFGALLGDLIESFFKRRIGKKTGERWLGFDQLDFLFGSWIFCFICSDLAKILGMSGANWFLSSFSRWHIIFLLIFTPFLHYAVNFIGYKIGMKEVPW
jgi:CDP-2,3-bis-(O-geranylgeranyl)-sn-glycerol synthase